MMIRKKDILLGVFFILLYCTPYVILGANAYVTIHDFLDLTIGHLKNITNNDLFFSLGSKVPVMDGISRMAIPYTSPFDIKNIIFYIIPSYWGLVIIILTLKIIAFCGMYLLLKQYIVKNSRWIPFIVSILFSLTPFYVDYSLSSAGIPLLFYAFINLHFKSNTLLSYLIVLFYAFNSSLALSGLFICFLLALFIIYAFYNKHELENRLVIALLILFIIYVLTNWELLINFFFNSGVKSSRIEMINHFSFEELINKCISILRSGSYHAGVFVAKPILVLFFAVFLFYIKTDKSLYLYLICYLLLSLFIVTGTLVKILPFKLFSNFQFDRFYFLYTSMCYFLLAKSCDVLIKNKKIIISGIFIILSLYNTFQVNTEFQDNIHRLFRANNVTENPSYLQFYDERLFRNISCDLSIPQDYSTKVLSVGMYPSIPEYNGFYCLDGYVSSYSLDYKHRFRQIIKGELDKSIILKNYYDEWGNRCYTFSSELENIGFLCGKKSVIELNDLQLDLSEAKEMGCKYIFSSVYIKNFQKIGLKYLNHYTTDNSFWDIKVYEVI